MHLGCVARVGQPIVEREERREFSWALVGSAMAVQCGEEEGEGEGYGAGQRGRRGDLST